MTAVTFESLPGLIKNSFGGRVSIPLVNSDTGEVTFILYESFLFKCGIDSRYGRFGLAMMVDGIAVRTFFGKRVTMDNDPDAIQSSLQEIDRFCRLRLPEPFLAEFDAAISTSPRR